MKTVIGSETERRHAIEQAAGLDDLRDALRRLWDIALGGGDDEAACPLAEVAYGRRVAVRLGNGHIAVAIVRDPKAEGVPWWARRRAHETVVRWVTRPLWVDETDPEWGTLPNTLLALPLDAPIIDVKRELERGLRHLGIEATVEPGEPGRYIIRQDETVLCRAAPGRDVREGIAVALDVAAACDKSGDRSPGLPRIMEIMGY